MIARNPNKKSATTKDPIVKVVRSFFRNKFALINERYFMPRLPPQSPLLPLAPPCSSATSPAPAQRPSDHASPSRSSSRALSRAASKSPEFHRRSCGQDLRSARRTSKKSDQPQSLAQSPHAAPVRRKVAVDSD